MNAQLFYTAAVPEPWQILGLQMRPFSAGHLLLLNRVESGFVVGDGTVTWDDLSLSVFICSRTFEEACAAFASPDLPKFMRRWYRKITGPWWNRTQLNLKEKAAEFSAYLGEAAKTPTYMAKGEGGIGDVPAVQSVKAYLLSKFTMTESEFYNRPWALSIWDMLTLQAIDGQVTLVDDEQFSNAQEIGKRLAELVRAGKIKPQA